MAINTDKVLISHSEIEQMLDKVSAELNRDYYAATISYICYIYFCINN